MYTFSKKLKTFSFILMILGALGVGYGFMTSQKSFEEVETLLATEETGHGGGHGEEAGHAAAMMIPKHMPIVMVRKHKHESLRCNHKKHVEHVCIKSITDLMQLYTLQHFSL